jgi:hypothetical protein
VKLGEIAIPLRRGGKHKEKISLRHDRKHKENSREKCSM